MNNAFAKGKMGEALFYAEKNEEIFRQRKISSFVTPYIKLVIWSRSGNDDKILETYKQYSKRINYLGKHQVADSTILEYLQSMQFIYYSIRSLKKTDSTLAIEANKQIRAIGKQVMHQLPLLQNIKISEGIPIILTLFSDMDMLDYTHKLSQAQPVLDSIRFVFKHYNLGPYLVPYQRIFYDYAFNYYLNKSDFILANQYLDSLNHVAKVFNDDNSKIYQSAALLNFKEGNILQAYSFMDSVSHYLKNETQIAYRDITNLSYNRTEADYNKLLLDKNNQKVSKQKRWIWGLSLLVLSIISIALLRIRFERKQSKKKIKDLNITVDIAIKEAKKYTRREEQKRLGRELHDNFSASLASAIHRVEMIKEKETDLKLKKDIEITENLLRENYNSIREISHRIFLKSNKDEEINFSQSVTKFIENALPSPHYLTNIELKDEITSYLTTTQRVELLKILKEAVANIIKHSKADEVSVFLFSNDGSNIFQISDNGKSKEIHKGFGLNSIEERAKTLNGQLEILQEDGMTIVVKFPKYHE